MACARIEGAASNRSRGQLVTDLAGLDLRRQWAPRLSVPTSPAPCGGLDSVPALRCSSVASVTNPAALADVARRAARGIDDRLDTDALHAAALIGLASSDLSGKPIERSISYLEMLTRLTPSAVDVYVDLSAARLASASISGGARVLLGALDAAEHALDLDRANVPASYNRALAEDLLGLNAQASSSWQSYLTHDSTSVYAAEARRRLEVIRSFDIAAPPDSTQPPQRFGEFAARAPAEARALVWERLLPAWGQAVLVNDTAAASALHRQASAIGRVVARDVRERSALDAVQSITAAGGNARLTRRLATLHMVYGRSQRFAQHSSYALADSGFLTILRDGAAPAALAALAAYGHCNDLIYFGRPDDALRSADSLVREISAERYAAVVARAEWIRGLLLRRASKTDAGLAAVHRARALFERLGEHDYVASAIGTEGETMLQMGSTSLGFAYVHRATVMLRNYPLSLWRHNALIVLARASTRSGLPYATRAIEDEDMVLVGGGPRAGSVVEARLARARSEWGAGRRASADTALAEAIRALAHVPAGQPKTQLSRELDLTMATRLASTRPDSARVLLDSVVAFFAPLHFPMKLIPALISRSAIALARGDTSAARRDLDRATATYVAARAEIAAAAQGTALLAQARDVFDRLVMLHINAGRFNMALRVHAASRGTFSVGSTSVEGDQFRRERVVTYSLIGDTLLTWVVHGGDTSFVRSAVDRAVLTRTIEQLRSGLELGAREAAIRPELERLYDLLIRPVEPQLGTDGSIVVAADDEITDVPFAALRDARRRAFLVERYQLRFAPTLSLSIATTAPASPHRALFVANPATDNRTFANLAPLPSADEEARAVAALYPSSRLLTSVSADSGAIARALEESDLFHFAGHAVLDDVEPNRSYLAVGSRGLTAGSIAEWKLPHVGLVVLSACETMRSAQQSSGGFFGLTDAFLAAGARGVIGSSWRIEDGATRRLMENFHRAYARSGDAARSLRDAQLSMIRTGVGSPSAWAGFRYVGF